jgi:hypothetical protein
MKETLTIITNCYTTNYNYNYYNYDYSSIYNYYYN